MTDCPYCDGPWPCADGRCIACAPCDGCGHPTTLESLPDGSVAVFCGHCGREERWPSYDSPVKPEPEEEVPDILPF